jgi:hypothetical protein
MRGSTVLGIAALVLVAVVLLNGIRTEGPGSRGVPEGEMLPPFAAPLAFGPDADANLAIEANQGDAGKRPACEVRGEEILNVCELYEQGPVALAFFATRSDRCEEQIDVLDRVDTDVQVVAVAVRGDQADVQKRVREHGWKLPVAWDRDGAVANRYAVAVCPTITFADRGGKVAGTSFDFLDEAALKGRLAELE